MNWRKIKHSVGGYWGNHISFFDYEKLKKILAEGMTDETSDTFLFGHSSFVPEEGELVKAEFPNITLVMKIREVQKEDNPHDMFWLQTNVIDIIRKE